MADREEDHCATGEQFPDGIGWLLRQLLNPEPQPGPPYVHTFNAPEPDGYDEHGDPIYLLKPTYTITRNRP